MAEKLYGIWHQQRINENLRFLPGYNIDRWYSINRTVFATHDVRLARAQAINAMLGDNPLFFNYTVCEIGDDGRPCNCDGELWEDVEAN